MLGKFTADNDIDVNGNPTGGTVKGAGLEISWQNGPLGRGNDRKEPNGAFVETVIAAVIQRIEFYQTASKRKVQKPRKCSSHYQVGTRFPSLRPLVKPHSGLRSSIT